MKQNKSQAVIMGAYTFFMVAIIFGIIGWVLNIVKIFGLTQIDIEAVIRVLGVFAFPVGAVAGYM